MAAGGGFGPILTCSVPGFRFRSDGAFTMATLKLEIATPQAKVYSGDVEMVTLPGIEGDLGIYPHHVPLVTQLVAGQVIARKGGQDQSLSITEGFAEITGDHVSILVGSEN